MKLFWMCKLRIKEAKWTSSEALRPVAMSKVMVST
jgi:hypothetical protein